MAELRDCVALQRTVWGAEFTEVVPVAILRVGPRIGGVTAGAFDEEGDLVGFVFGLTGVEDDGRIVHWSDMLAVRPDVRNRGLGRRLKAYQRAAVRRVGAEVIYWTFDPLVARNAHLNLNRLGARVQEYVPDMYGTTDSPLHGGLETDRFVVAWDVVEPEGAGSTSSDEILPPLVNRGDNGRDVDLAPARAGAPAVRIRIPCDFHSIQTSSPGEARAWRLGTREAFTELLALGYRVTGFHRTAGNVAAGTGVVDEESEGCWYVLAPAAADRQGS